MNRILTATAVALSTAILVPAQPAGAQGTVPGSDYALTPAPDRIFVSIPRTERGNTVPIDHARLTRLCGDEDGCSVRIGMHNWDNTGRVASREFLFYSNRRNGVWRVSLGDVAGTDANTTTEYPVRAWACRISDGAFRNWEPQGDTGAGFFLLSWNEFNTDCWLTIID